MSLQLLKISFCSFKAIPDTPQVGLQSKISSYQPEVSDISDNELVDSVEMAEKSQSLPHLGLRSLGLQSSNVPAKPRLYQKQVKNLL